MVRKLNISLLEDDYDLAEMEKPGGLGIKRVSHQRNERAHSGLAGYEGEKRTFRGYFKRYSFTTDHRLEPTFLLGDVIDVRSGRKVARHLWLKVEPAVACAGLLYPGDEMSFEAVAGRYRKSNGKIAFCLKRIRSVVVDRQSDVHEDLPIEREALVAFILRLNAETRKGAKVA
jgi:hypothetical protein